MIVATESKEWKKIEGVNSGGNMDRGPMTFTSDVSLPKYDKSASEVNKSQLGNWQDWHRNANYATKKGRAQKQWAVRQGK